MKRLSNDEKISLSNRPVYLPVGWLSGPTCYIDSKVTIQESTDLLILTRELRDWPAFISKLLMSLFIAAILLPLFILIVAQLPIQLAATIFLLVGLVCAWFQIRDLLEELFAVETLRIDDDSIVMEIRSPLKSRLTKLLKSDLRAVATVTPPSISKGRLHALRIRSTSRNHLCFRGISTIDAFCLQPLVNEHAGRLAGFKRCSVTAQASDAHIEKKCLSEKYIHWVKVNPATHKPADTDWQMDIGFTGMNFNLAGRFNGWNFVEHMFNVIISAFFTKVFLLGKFKAHLASTWSNADVIHRAALFLFITFAAAVVLKFLWNLAAVGFARAYRETWEFSRNKIESRFGWFGVSRTQSWDIVTLKGIAITKTGRYNRTRLAPRSEYTYDLNFIGHDGLVICRIVDLRFNEANWLGQHVMNHRPEWFKEQSTAH